MRKPKAFFMQRKRVSEETSKEEAVFWTLWRHRELCRNDIATRKRGNRFDNNDPCINNNVQVKPTLIDLEGYGESYADRAEDICHRERLSERALKSDTIVRTLQRKAMKLAEMTNSLERGVTIWLRHTAGCSFYQGQCQLKNWIALVKPEIIDLETAA